MHIINNFKRKILLFKLLFGISKFPKMKLSEQEEVKLGSLQKFMEQEHAKYVRTISSPDMAMSIELAKYLLKYCMANKPQHLIDLGSGFSSFVFRLYQNEINEQAVVYSIDDDEKWLQKTQTYLQTFKLCTEKLLTVEELQKLDLNGYFDLVLLDLNYVEKRKNFIAYSLQIKKNGGVVIADDVHKVEFLREVISKSKLQHQNLYDLRHCSRDAFGRFAIAIQ